MKFHFSCLAGLLITTSCTQLNIAYDAVAPPTQYEHELAEVGHDSIKAADRTKLARQPGTDFSLQKPRPLNLARDTYIVLQIVKFFQDVVEEHSAVSFRSLFGGVTLGVDGLQLSNADLGVKRGGIDFLMAERKVWRAYNKGNC